MAMKRRIVEAKMATAMLPFFISASSSRFFSIFLSIMMSASTPITKAMIVKIRFTPKLNSAAIRKVVSIFFSLFLFFSFQWVLFTLAGFSFL